MNRTKVRTGRFLLYFFISAIVITAAGTITAVFLFPTERLIDMVSRSIEERTGFTPAIGNIQPGLGRVIVTNTTLFAKKSKQPVLIARSISLGFSWIKLFTGTMEITDIIISKSTIELRFMKHGMTELEKLLTDETGRRSKEKGTVAVDLKNITFKKCLVKVIKPTGPYKPLKGEYIVSGTLVPHGKGLLFKSFSITPPRGGKIDTDLNLTFPRARGFLLAGSVSLKKVPINWTYQWSGRDLLPFRTATGEVKNLEIDNRSVKGFLNVVSTLRNLKDSIKVTGACLVDWKSKDVILNNIEASIPNGQLSLPNARYNYGSDTMAFTVSSPGISLPLVRYILPRLPENLGGTISGKLAYNKNLWSGTVALHNCWVGTGKLTMSNINSKVHIKENNFKIADIPFMLKGSPGTISLLSLKHGREIDIRLNLTSYDWDWSSRKKIAGISIPIDSKITGRVVINRLKVWKIFTSRLIMDFSMKKKKVKIRRLIIYPFGGKVQATGTVDLRKGPRLQAVITAEKLHLHKIAAYSDKYSGTIYGLISGKGKVDAILTPQKIARGRGIFHFTVANGTFTSTGIQQRLGELLPDLRDRLNEIEFTSIKGALVARKNSIILEDFFFESPDLKLMVSGSLTRKFEVKPAIELELFFTPAFIEELPGTTVKLLNLDSSFSNGWYNLPFLIEGNLTGRSRVSRVER